MRNMFTPYTVGVYKEYSSHDHVLTFHIHTSCDFSRCITNETTGNIGFGGRG